MSLKYVYIERVFLFSFLNMTKDILFISQAIELLNSGMIFCFFLH